jgi:hypothetical protein
MGIATGSGCINVVMMTEFVGSLSLESGRVVVMKDLDGRLWAVVFDQKGRRRGDDGEEDKKSQKWAMSQYLSLIPHRFLLCLHVDIFVQSIPGYHLSSYCAAGVLNSNVHRTRGCK